MVPKKNKQRIEPLLIAPDRATLGYVCQALDKAGITCSTTMILRSGMGKKLAERRTDNTSVVILAQGPKNFGDQMLITEAAIEAGHFVLIWSTGTDAVETSAEDAWLLERLLEQLGAVGCSRLSTIVRATKILTACGAAPPNRIRAIGKSSGLKSRLVSALSKVGIKTGETKTGWSLEVSETSAIVLKSGSKAVEMTDLSSVVDSISLIRKTALPAVDPEELKIDPLRREIDLIARPPARLLSETTSKRLAACFGLGFPREQLCSSATEAVRFAASIEGPVVAKLVKPSLENKAAIGAVRVDLQSQAAVRRAVHALHALDDSLGPPLALGVLVAEQLKGGDRIWVRLENHPCFGRVLLFGAGDTIDSPPIAVLKTPATIQQAQRAVGRDSLASTKTGTEKLAAAIWRLSVMADQLGDRISRAEFHPLVALPDQEEALCLDGLVAIGAP